MERREREDGRRDDGARRRSRTPDRRKMGRGRREESGRERRDERGGYPGSPERRHSRREESSGGRRHERGGHGSHSPRHHNRDEVGRKRCRSPFRGRAREGRRKEDAVPPLVVLPGSDPKKEKEEGKSEAAKGNKRFTAPSLRWREIGDASIAPSLPLLPPRDTRVNSDTSSSLDGGTEKVVPLYVPFVNMGAPPKSPATDPRLKRRSEEETVKPHSLVGIPSKEDSIDVEKELRLARRKLQAMAAISSQQETTATKPVNDSRTLCFDLPYGCDYERIIAHFEIVLARVIVLRRPSIDRSGVGVLKYECAEYAQILQKDHGKNHGSDEFEGLNERLKIKPSFPGRILFFTNKENLDVLKMEMEIEANFGSVAEISMNSSNSGTVWFVNEKHAKDALSTGSHICSSRLPDVIIAFKGVFVRGEKVDEWKVEMDEEWSHHRVKMQEARAVQRTIQNNKKRWDHPDKKQAIKNQVYEMDGEGVVTLVGGPVMFGLDIDLVKDHFTRNFKVVYMEEYDFPASEDHDPGIVEIIVKEEDAADLLSVTHSIDGFTFYVGLPGPIEMTTQSMTGWELKMLAREFTHKFGAVIGMRPMGEVKGLERYRVTFMTWDYAVTAHNWLSVFKGRSFLSWMPDHILVDVVRLETWKNVDEPLMADEEPLRTDEEPLRITEEPLRTAEKPVDEEPLRTSTIKLPKTINFVI